MTSLVSQNSIEVPSSDRVEPGSFPLHLANFPILSLPNLVDADSVATTWVESFNKAISSAETADVPKLFLDESYWRDQLCLSWDFRCLQGNEKIFSLLNESKAGSRIKSLALDRTSELRSPTAIIFGSERQANTVQAFLTVNTDIGRGAGIVRLVQDQGLWKAFTLFTFLEELKGHEEVVGKKRPNGVEHGEHISRKNWLDRRNAEENYEDGLEPTVLILGKF